MLALRRLAAVASSSSSKVILTRTTYRGLSSTLDDKKKGNEAAYIKAQEAKRMAEAKAKFEALMKSENSEEKAELIEMLASKPEAEKSVISKFGLDDWKFALPIGLLIGIPTMANEVIVLSAESQLLACFILFCSTMYTQAGGMIAKSLDDYRENVYTTLKKVDDSMLVDIQSSIVANKKVLGMEQDIGSVHNLLDDLAQAQAQALNMSEEHKYRDAVAKKLDSLVALEESAVASIRARMLAKVKSDVIKTFNEDAKAKERALEAAVAVLKAGPTGKLGKDIVGEVYLSSLKTYKDAYAKLPAGSDEILVQLEKDIAATSTAPVIEFTGGNVYETHPLIAAKAK